MNHFGQYTKTKQGNGVITDRYYDQYGLPKHFKADNTALLDLEFDFDPQNGNLKSRYDGTKFLLEEFKYDGLDRLTQTKVNGNIQIDINYSLSGNISYKGDAGYYTYNASRINAVETINQTNTNISLMQQNVTYNNFNSPKTIIEDVHELTLIYGPNEQRKKTVYTDGTNNINKYFLGNYEIVEDANTGNKTQIHYVAGGDGLTAILTINPNGVEETHFVYTDHLGSILSLSDDLGNITLEQNFDAWGRERKAGTWEYANATSVGESNNFKWLTRGYTGHEHLTAFKLINMNGRVYDPVVGRMLSVDNFVQDATSTQSFNRYSYVLNNPLKFTDPSGEVIHILAAAAIVGVVTGGINLYANWDNVDGFWEGAASFGVGFGSGFAAVATGGNSLWAQLAVAGATGAAVSATNDIVEQTDHFQGDVNWGRVGNSSLVGLGTGVVSFGAARGFSHVFRGDIKIGSQLISGRSIPGQAIKQSIGGYGGGYVTGLTSGYISTGDWGLAHRSGLKSGATGGILGLGFGVSSAIYNAQQGGYNAWSGKFTERSVRSRFDIPDYFEYKDSKKGFTLYDPKNTNNQIRFRNTDVLYYKAQMNGTFYDNFGNPLNGVLKNAPETHIRIDNTKTFILPPWER